MGELECQVTESWCKRSACARRETQAILQAICKEASRSAFAEAGAAVRAATPREPSLSSFHPFPDTPVQPWYLDRAIVVFHSLAPVFHKRVRALARFAVSCDILRK